jgi:hypothetical protein
LVGCLNAPIQLKQIDQFEVEALLGRNGVTPR